MNFIKSIFFLSLAGVDNEDNNPVSPTIPNIRYKFESPHASPFRLLAVLNQATNSSLPTPLSTTSSTLQSSALLNSGFDSSSPLFSWTLFVIFFFSPVGTFMLLRLILSYFTTILQSNQLNLLTYSS